MRKKYQIKGSMTVEATLVFPLFFFVIVGFIYFFQVFKTQTAIQGNITEIAKEASRYGYLYESLTSTDKDNKEEDNATEGTKKEVKNILAKLAEGTFYKWRFQKLVSDNETLEGVDGGIDGISFLGSSFMEEDGIIEVKASYRVKIPVPFFSHFTFPVVQQVKTRGFIGASLIENTEGDQSSSGDEEYVFITKNGVVYHSHADCTYLKVKISSVKREQLEYLRNKSGGIYYPCEACAVGSNQAHYYITEFGNRYHTAKICTKIDRNVITIKKSEVGSRRPCSKCYP